MNPEEGDEGDMGGETGFDDVSGAEVDSFGGQ